jgi:aldehyde:ferredoxin oxidoreductase
MRSITDDEIAVLPAGELWGLGKGGDTEALPAPVRHWIARDFDAMFDRYYALRNSADGVLAAETLARLNLGDMVVAG